MNVGNVFENCSSEVVPCDPDILLAIQKAELQFEKVYWELNEQERTELDENAKEYEQN